MKSMKAYYPRKTHVHKKTCTRMFITCIDLIVSKYKYHQ